MTDEYSSMRYGPDILAPTPGVFFVDTETTGLWRHSQIWEVALITPEGDQHVWVMDGIHIANADLRALKINGFMERYPKAKKVTYQQFLEDFGKLTWDLHWAGMVPSFDESRIWSTYDQWDHTLSVPLGGWSHHLIDVESMALGYLGAAKVGIPWESKDFGPLLGIEPSDLPIDQKHTALGDARYAKKIYLATAGELPPPEEDED